MVAQPDSILRLTHPRVPAGLMTPPASVHRLTWPRFYTPPSGTAYRRSRDASPRTSTVHWRRLSV